MVGQNDVIFYRHYKKIPEINLLNLGKLHQKKRKNWGGGGGLKLTHQQNKGTLYRPTFVNLQFVVKLLS